MGQQTFEFLLLAMSALAVIVFVALYYVRAGYGMFHTPKWGLSVNNKLGWVLMEAPVFLVIQKEEKRGKERHQNARCYSTTDKALQGIQALFYLPFPDERKEPDAPCHYVDGSGL